MTLGITGGTGKKLNIFSKVEIEHLISRPSSMSPEKLQKQNSVQKIVPLELDYVSDYVYKESPGYGCSLPAENFYSVKPEVSRIKSINGM
jgi:hypothetical protein